LDYLSCGIEDKSKIAFTNALEIAEQYTVKERLFLQCSLLTIGLKMATEVAFKPFAPLRSEGNHLKDKVHKIQEMIDQKRYAEAIHASAALMRLTLAGFRYLQTYEANLKSLISVMIGYSSVHSLQLDFWDGLYLFSFMFLTHIFFQSRSLRIEELLYTIT
jgi:hypothetical protein